MQTFFKVAAVVVAIASSIYFLQAAGLVGAEVPTRVWAALNGLVALSIAANWWFNAKARD